MLKENNLNLHNQFSFPDHYNYKKKDIDKLLIQSKKSDSILLTTEKDYFRINDDYKKNIKGQP